MVDPAVDVDDKRVIRVFILDDHELVRRGLTDLLGSADAAGSRSAETSAPLIPKSAV
jgi:DNA-binding NarL/FixJ family response regulator